MKDQDLRRLDNRRIGRCVQVYNMSRGSSRVVGQVERAAEHMEHWQSGKTTRYVDGLLPSTRWRYQAGTEVQLWRRLNWIAIIASFTQSCNQRLIRLCGLTDLEPFWEEDIITESCWLDVLYCDQIMFVFVVTKHLQRKMQDVEIRHSSYSIPQYS